MSQDRDLQRIAGEVGRMVFNPDGSVRNSGLLVRMRKATQVVARRFKAWGDAWYKRGRMHGKAAARKWDRAARRVCGRPLPGWDREDEETALALLAVAHDYCRAPAFRDRDSDYPARAILDENDADDLEALYALAGLFQARAELGDAGKEYDLDGRLACLSRPGSPTKESKGKRGRPSDTDQKADAKLAEAWQSGSYRTYAELAREKGMSAREVGLALERVRNRRRRRAVK